MLIPPFLRFPFMAPNDLQCGDIWTEPSERGRGLAVAGVSASVRHAWQSGRRIWYLTEEGNEPSQRLARHIGFSLVGEGQRTRRLGFRIFGQFVVTSASHDIR
jgi:RimJ/RimL family protein N-acetyltransferase